MIRRSRPLRFENERHEVLRRHPSTSNLRVSLSDGAFTVDYHRGDHDDDDLHLQGIYYDRMGFGEGALRPVVLIVPGLAGSSKMHYVRRMVAACHHKGWFTVVLNHRGCCDAELESHRLFMYGDFADLARAVERVSTRWPHSPLFLCGFSMGGNIVSNYLGQVNRSQRPPEANIVGAASLCQGYDLQAASAALSPFYSRMLTAKMKAIVNKHRDVIDEHPELDISAILSSSSHEEFDTLYTVVAHSSDDGHRYPSREHYYSDQSSAPHLATVDVPLLCFNALDDPLVPDECLPRKAQQENENIVLVLSPKGGHLGLAIGDSWVIPDDSNLADNLVPSFFESLLIDHYKKNQ